MNIRYKLLVQFSLIVVTIVLILTIGIFFFSSNYRQTDYYSRLEDKANTTARLLFNVEEVNEALLKIIDKNILALFQENIYIINEENELVYFNPPDIVPNIDTILLNQIRNKGKLKFKENKREVLGILYNFNDLNYVIIISAFDKYGLAKIKNLKIILITGLVISVIATLIIGLFFASRALEPISNVINQVKDITISNLSQRVDEGNKKDEIAQLAITFNQMLQRIEEAFILQHDFVSNAAHELRTPFTVLLAEVDYTLMQERDREHYKAVLVSLSKEIKKLSILSNGLLDLAMISFDKSTFNLTRIRVDELLVEVCNSFLNANGKYKIEINFDSMPDDDDQLSVFGNEQLLAIAFKNLIDNASKFSDFKPVKIDIRSVDQNLNINVSDQGIGIPNDDIEKIFQPFYRGKNTHFIDGYGIGLALTLKIVLLHNGKIKVETELEKGSTFIVTIPNRQHF